MRKARAETHPRAALSRLVHQRPTAGTIAEYGVESTWPFYRVQEAWSIRPGDLRFISLDRRNR